MSPAPGVRLGPYEIIDKLGAGGMGDVYRARDTRLDRIVALKVSKSEFNERFDREARAVAALNHPHICQLFDVGPNYLVMEYLEGTPLEGPLPVAKAVEYASQILDALESAHRKGITHRDLKPANILVTKQGIKLLDFGLAKLAGVGLKESEDTLTQAMTSQGQIVGTLQYMSPEQVQGLPVDGRSDIFSFGLVFYEILTGKRAFDARSGASLIASVLKDQPPPLREVLPSAPASLQRVLSLCLDKDPDNRWQNALDLRRELIWAMEEPPPAPKPQTSQRSRVTWILIAAIPLALALGFLAARWWFAPQPEALETEPLTTLAGIESEPAFSPDGKFVAFTWTGPDYGAGKICVKQLDASEPLVLSHGDEDHGSPTWSPDGKQIAFLRFNGGHMELVTVPALGGPERPIGQGGQGDLHGGLCWLPGGNRIVLGVGIIASIDVGTGQATRLTKESDRSDLYPALSPDGRHLAFVRTTGITAAPAQILAFTLDKNQQPEGEPKLIAEMQGVGGLAWAPDGRSLIVTALRKGAQQLLRVQYVDGSTAPLIGLAAAGVQAGGISISPVTHNMAISVVENDTDIWRLPGPAWPASEPRPEPTRFIASTRDDVSPEYSPDGKRVAFESRRTGSQEIWTVNSDGHDAVQITNFGGPAVGTPRWSPDGTRIAFDSRKFGKGDVFLVNSNGGTATRRTNDRFINNLPVWSADGRWIFYGSNRSGRQEIWKIAADGSGSALQVTKNGAASPQHVHGLPWVYYWWNGIWRVPESGGMPELIVHSPWVGFWAPWKDGIVRYAGDYTVASFRFSDRKETVIAHLPRPESPRFLRRETMTVSPDGRWVLMNMTALDRADLLLVHDLR